jgi:hypothetical protein
VLPTLAMIALERLPLPDEADDRAFLDVWIQDFGACALSAADEVGLFGALGERERTAADLAASLMLDVGALVATCRALVTMGALLATDAGFVLSSSGRLFWWKESPCYRGREFYQHWDWDQHQRIVEALRVGWSPLLDTEEPFSEAWARGDVSQESAQNFTRVMHSLILAPSLAAVKSGAFSAVTHLVDVGGGSGALAATLLAHQPACRATVMDLAPVCEASKTILASVESGVKVEYFPANFFADAWPFDADAFSLSNILHDWPLSRCREILSRVFAALPAGGRVFVLEALLDAGCCTPRMTVLFNLLMQINHRGQQFTSQQLFELLVETGFSEPHVVHTYSYWSLVTARKPA